VAQQQEYCLEAEEQERFLCPGRKPNGTPVNSEPISCHPIDPITPRFPSLYPWSTSDRDVVSIGFVIGAIPLYQMSDHFTDHLRTTIVKTCKTKRVSPFKYVLCRISAQYRGRSVSCEAFDIQVRRVEVDKVVWFVCKALPAQGTQSIMLYSDRYNNPDRFAAAVTLQAKHQEAHRIVSTKGIPDSEIFSFEGNLRREFPQILDILPTHTTTLGNPANQFIGRWNVKCATSHFQELAKNLSTKLKLLYDDHLKSNGMALLDGAEEVTVVSRFKGKPQMDAASSAMSRDNGKESYNSSWTSRLADFHVETDILKKYCKDYNPIQALVSPLNLLPRKIPPLGFEPRMQDSKSWVIPFHHRGS
jgi:hypothetical protein